MHSQISNHGEDSYLQHLDVIMSHGYHRSNERTGVGTRALFCQHLSFDLRNGSLPLLTTKKVHFKSVLVELLWFLSGSTNVKPLQAQGVSIWDEWAAADGELGPVYGSQWRYWNGSVLERAGGMAGETYSQNAVDQVAALIAGIKKDPQGRRHIVTAWNPSDLPSQKLPPCHCFFQCFVTDEGLILSMYQRSADWFLGVPFNIASYATLTHMLAQVCGMKARGLTITFGDAHVYNNHHDAATLQLSRKTSPAPKLIIDPSIDNIDDFAYSHFTVEGYNPQPAIKAPVAV